MAPTECRTCLEPISGSSIISVQAKVTDEKNVLESIEELASLQVHDDDCFPKYICRKCFKLLKSTISFRRLIISSYAEFKAKLTGDLQAINKKVPKINSKTEFISVEDQLEKRTDFKIESDSVQTPAHEKYLLDDTKNVETKAETEEQTFENDDSSGFTEIDETEVFNAEPKTITKRMYRTRKKDKNTNLTKKCTQTDKGSKNTSRICSLCGKVVKGKQNYNAHIKMHNNQIPPLVYICPVCPKQFSQKKYLLVHRRSHTGEKPFHCDICNKNFSQFASFYVHKRRLHDKVVQGTCSYCGKKFVDKPELDVHIKMWHTGERPYLCEFCSATFVCNRTLQRHRRELHSEKTPCQKCGKMLGDYALKKHLVRHQVLEEGLKIIRKKYTCEYCKTVMNFTSRRRHLEKQHGIKLYGRGDDCKKVSIKETSDSTWKNHNA